jgi:hypothetical protein
MGRSHQEPTESATCFRGEQALVELGNLSIRVRHRVDLELAEAMLGVEAPVLAQMQSG